MITKYFCTVKLILYEYFSFIYLYSFIKQFFSVKLLKLNDNKKTKLCSKSFFECNDTFFFYFQ